MRQVKPRMLGDGLETNPMQQVHGHSFAYRIEVGSLLGNKFFTLQPQLVVSRTQVDQPVQTEVQLRAASCIFQSCERPQSSWLSSSSSASPYRSHSTSGGTLARSRRSAHIAEWSLQPLVRQS